MHSGWIPVGADRVYYEDLGSGCPVILVSGGSGMDQRQWDSVSPLLGTDYRVIRFDPRGLGRSANPSELHRGTADLATLLDSLRLRSAVLVGLSAAGGAVLEFAVEHPDRVRGVVAIAALVPGFAFSQPMLDRLGEFADAARRGRDPFLDRMLADPYFFPAPLRPTVRNTARLLMAAQYEKSAEADQSLMLAMTPPLLDRLSQVRAPVLLPVGALDHPEVRRRNTFVASAIPEAREVVIPSSGHNVPLENPGVLVREVDGFLRTACGAAGPGVSREEPLPPSPGAHR